MSINVVARITVQPGNGPNFEAIVAQAREIVTANPACHRYDLQRLRKSEVDYIMLETWATVDALRQHGASAAFREFSVKLAGIVDGAPTVEVYEPVGAQAT